MAEPILAFEESISDNPEYTPIAEGHAFLQEVGTQSSRMSYASLGASVQGNPIYMARIGGYAPPTDAELFSKSIIMVIASQHGNEPNGREAAFQLIRDLAFTTDQSLIDYLEAHPIIIIPEANIDRMDNTRSNANGVDLNRDWALLSQPETQAMSLAVRDFRPAIVLDLHQTGGSSNSFETLHSTSYDINAAIGALSSDLRNIFNAALQGAGFVVGTYGGGRDASILRNNGGLGNIVTLLVEANSDEAVLTRKNAVSGTLVGLDSAIGWHNTNSGLIRQTVSQGKLDSLQAGIDKAAMTDPALASTPLGYLLTSTQYGTASTPLASKGIKSYPVSASSDYFVPVAQHLRNHIPVMLDSASTFGVVAGTGVETQPALDGAVPSYNVRVFDSGSGVLVDAGLALTQTTYDVEGLTAATDYEFDVQAQVAGETGNWSSRLLFTTTAGGSLAESASSADIWSAVCSAGLSFANTATASDNLSVIASVNTTIISAAQASDMAGDSPAANVNLQSVATGNTAVDAMASAGAALTAGASAGELWSAQAQVVVNLLEQGAASDTITRATENALNSAISEGSAAAVQFLAAITSIATLTDSASIEDAFLAVVATIGSLSSGAIGSDTFSVNLGQIKSLESGAITGAAWFLFASINASILDVCSAEAIFRAHLDVRQSISATAIAGDQFSILNAEVRYLVLGAVTLRTALHYSVTFKP